MSAVAAGLGVVGTAAHAVYVDPNGQGQALIYPYYTVQNTANGNAFNTYVSVVNTTTWTKVVKVRFREGKASKEVLDFNLYLSPNDVWTGAVVPASTSATAPGRLITADVSCTNPAIPAAGVDFRNYLYSGSNDDGLGTGLERTREGYLEMIEMARFDATINPGNLAVHLSTTGLPRACSSLQGATVTLANQLPPNGGLNGTGTLINVNNGADAGYNAVALAALASVPMYQDVGDDTPNFASPQIDPNSIVISGNKAYRSDWTFREDAVSSTLMHSNVINEFVLDTGTKSNTDWVMTFPTKHHYVLGPENTDVFPPFTNGLDPTDGACEPITFTSFNREERGAASTPGDFSPRPPGAPASALCWESTVMSIRNGQAHMPTGLISGVLGSANVTPVNVNTAWENGWANLRFTGVNALTPVGLDSLATSNTVTLTPLATVTGAQEYTGLPVVGFMVRTFNNGTLTCAEGKCQGTYGSAFEHKYQQTITP